MGRTRTYVAVWCVCAAGRRQMQILLAAAVVWQIIGTSRIVPPWGWTRLLRSSLIFFKRGGKRGKERKREEEREEGRERGEGERVRERIAFGFVFQGEGETTENLPILSGPVGSCLSWPKRLSHFAPGCPNSPQPTS